jgi:MSHA biogenesis protein MshP
MSRRTQRGVSLIAAIFLLVVLGGLIAYLVKLAGLQQSSAALDVLGARAYQAARAGIEWGVYRTLQDGVCAGGSFTPSGQFSGFTVTVQCVATGYTEVDATAKTIYSITATACNQGACPGTPGPTYVERQLQVTVDKSS